MSAFRQRFAIVFLGLLLQSGVAMAEEKAKLPPAPVNAPATEPKGPTMDQLIRAENEDDATDRADTPNSFNDLPNIAAHGIRERVVQRGVFMDQSCVLGRGEIPYCYCAAHVVMPVFSRRIYTTAARSLTNNVWDFAEDVVDIGYCPPNFTKRRTEEPEGFKETAGLSFFQRIEVPVFNKDYVSLVYDTYERDGDEIPLRMKYGILVDVKQRRPMVLSQVLGIAQDAKLTSVVNAELKKQDPKAKTVKISGGNSEDIDAFYLAPEGVVLQFGPDTVSELDRTLSVTIPASLIAQPAVRQLLQPQG